VRKLESGVLDGAAHPLADWKNISCRAQNIGGRTFGPASESTFPQSFAKTLKPRVSKIQHNKIANCVRSVLLFV
jgi:hypothetical protein